ncbi:MAG: phytoene/squalene synthase family protein [Gemmatimonadaceae bacterium]
MRTHARTFWLASHFLGLKKRRSAFALYAFCRVADDLVDLAGPNDKGDTARRLSELRGQLDDALAGRPSGPVFREIHRTVARHGVPFVVLHELLDGVASDCEPARYATWPELHRYCEAVASTVGEMCTYVFGVDGDDRVRARALSHARTLGVAMQLTNILRDVGEDARNGRCYLPDEDLARFGLSRQDVLAGVAAGDRRWRGLMKFEIVRARALYESAWPGIALLAPDARRCATACGAGYAGILGAIEANGYDTFGVRARLGARARGAVLWKALRTPLESAGGQQRTPLARNPRDEGIATWASANQQ